MAEKLDISPAFLSGVENGKRKIPSDWVNRISETYHLGEAEKAHLQEAFYDTNNSVEIGLEKLQSPRRNLVLSFARKLDSISDVEAEQISRILNKRRK